MEVFLVFNLGNMFNSELLKVEIKPKELKSKLVRNLIIATY